MIATTLTPLAGSLTGIAVGFVIGLLTAAVLSSRMHTRQQERIRRLRLAMRTAVSLLEDDRMAGFVARGLRQELVLDCAGEKQ